MHRALLNLDDATIDALREHVVAVIDEKVLEAVYRGEAPSASVIKAAAQDALSRIKRKREEAQKLAKKQ